MQVTFALTATQVIAVDKLLASWQAAIDEYRDTDYPWNFNGDQAFNLVDNKLTYKGQRHPLVEDGGLMMLAKLAGYYHPLDLKEGMDIPLWYEVLRASQRCALRAANADGWQRLKVVSYETTDRGLQWWETAEARMATRGSLVEWLTTGQGTQEYYAGINRLKGWLQVDASLKTAVKAVFKGASERQLNAAYTSAEIAQARAIIKHCRHSGISYFDEWFKESFVD